MPRSRRVLARWRCVMRRRSRSSARSARFGVADVIGHARNSRDGEPDSLWRMAFTHHEGRHSRRRTGHAIPARDQGDAEGDAARRRQARHPVRRRGGGRRRPHRRAHDHGPQQERPREPLRPRDRARGDARARRATPTGSQKVEYSTDLADVHYVRQGDPRGLGHAVLRAQDARRATSRSPCCSVTTSSTRATCCCSRMIEVQAEQERDRRRAARGRPRQSPTSTASRRSRRPTRTTSCASPDLVEKPAAGTAPSNLAIIGRYVLQPEIFDVLEHTEPGKGGEIQLTDALLDARRTKNIAGGVYGVVFRGRRYDTGDRLDYIKAIVQLAVDRDDLGPDLRPWLQELRGEPGLRRSDAALHPHPARRATSRSAPSGCGTARALERELAREPRLAAQVGGDQPGRADELRRARRASATCCTHARGGLGLPFVIEYDGELAGQLNVSSIAYGSLSSATIGYWVSERFAGRGLTPTAVALATDHCFFTRRPAPHGDLHPARERAEPARRREARVPLRGAAAAVHPHQRRLARPLLLRADRRRGADRGAAALASTAACPPARGPGARGRSQTRARLGLATPRASRSRWARARTVGAWSYRASVGGGVLLALAAGLWLVYLVPSWLRRREYLATERNAVRLQQTLRVLAETAEVPAAVRAETTARSVAEQQRTLRDARSRRAVDRCRAARPGCRRPPHRRPASPRRSPQSRPSSPLGKLAARRLRRTRALTSLLLLAALVTLVVQVRHGCRRGCRRSVGGAGVRLGGCACHPSPCSAVSRPSRVRARRRSRPTCRLVAQRVEPPRPSPTADRPGRPRHCRSRCTSRVPSCRTSSSRPMSRSPNCSPLPPRPTPPCAPPGRVAVDHAGPRLPSRAGSPASTSTRCCAAVAPPGSFSISPAVVKGWPSSRNSTDNRKAVRRRGL